MRSGIKNWPAPGKSLAGMGKGQQASSEQWAEPKKGVERWSLFFSADFSIFFFNSSYSCVLFAHFKEQKTVSALVAFLSSLGSSGAGSAAEPGWGSGAATPPSCSLCLASPIRRLCCLWRWWLHHVSPSSTPGSLWAVSCWVSSQASSMAVAWFCSASPWENLFGACSVLGGLRMVLGAGFPMGMQSRLGISGSCSQWSKGAFSAGSPQRGCWVSKGTRPDLLGVSCMSQQV